MKVTRQVVLYAIITAVFSVKTFAQMERESQSIQGIVSSARELAETEPVVEKIIPDYSEAGPAGTYYSVQLNQPPLPFNPFPELEVIELDPINGIYLLNDLNVDYDALDELVKIVKGFNGLKPSGGLFSPMSVQPGEPVLGISSLGGGLLDFTLTNAESNAVYDLYFTTNVAAPHWQWRRVYNEIQCDDAGEASWVLQQPDPTNGYFVALSANDDLATGSDGDGLTDGYEAWFNYDGQHSFTNATDSDLDGMRDGWEVQYGLNPTSTNGIDGATGNPDGDSDSAGPLTNEREFDWYATFNASFDPLKIYATPTNRPVVYITNFTAELSCDVSFTISRSAGEYATYTNPLTIYYAVGGNLSYDLGDYTLSNAPPEWPRIYSATIPAGEQEVTVTIDASVAAPPCVLATVVVSLTPYSVSPEPQVEDPGSWEYVVDWNKNRAIMHPLPCPPTGALFTANLAAPAAKPIRTFDFDRGTLTNSFLPDDAITNNANGRGLAIQGNEIFYTELSALNGPSDGIHVAPYGSEGSGGADLRTLPNPRPTAGIQDLAFHYDPALGTNLLYVLTGYQTNSPLKVFKLDSATGNEVGQSVSIDSQAAPDADGFTVLTNGNFLINDGDGAGDGMNGVVTTYREYDADSGELVTGGLLIDLSCFGFNQAFGVQLAPDGQSLYFAAGISGTTAMIQTDTEGRLLAAHFSDDVAGAEDIDVIVP